MIEKEDLEQWISEFHPTVETDVLEILWARVQYSILDQVNYMISEKVGTLDEIKKLILKEITDITNESIELEQE